MKKQKQTLSFVESSLASTIAGGIGIFMVMPFDMIFVRFQVDTTLPKEQRRGYTGLGNALCRVYNEEGLKTMWRGSIPAIARAMAINFGVLVPYEKCKNLFAPYLGWTKKNYIASSAVAGVGAAICGLPFDNAKIKIQKMRADANGKMPYKGLADCLSKTIAREGFLRLWAGLIPVYLIAAPHAMMTLLISDGLRIFLGVSKT